LLTIVAVQFRPPEFIELALDDVTERMLDARALEFIELLLEDCGLTEL
jgi:hypothetical protein